MTGQLFASDFALHAMLGAAKQTAKQADKKTGEW
jgi:hypothetical protein